MIHVSATFTGYSLRELPKVPARISPISRVQTLAADYFSIPREEMYSTRRLRDIARPRQIAMYLCYHRLGKSLCAIARQFHKHHTTVMHALAAVEVLRATDPEIAADIAALDRLIAKVA